MTARSKPAKANSPTLSSHSSSNASSVKVSSPLNPSPSPKAHPALFPPETQVPGSLLPRLSSHRLQERKESTVPHEQTEDWIYTRERVGEAAVNVLGITSQVGHELLEVSGNALRFAPVVGLEEAAHTLPNICNALQLTDRSIPAYE
ncbi:hypothetical protein BN946_scf184789.g2 [Trametes cinnabarina]|uniref:Uncharacterized protein n=1 Tax=Pycnoporus cinnabarinus TaxID=5643 RepID=A0A060SVR9_PYCCI|nr:hypothetical protein BN946_scf184789.g2 [Trametes cinnabarina]